MKELKVGIMSGSHGSFISKLWRQIVNDDGYFRYIIRLRNAYISRMCSRAELSNTEINLNRTNIDNKITADDMTWKNFIFLLKDILSIVDLKVEFKVTLIKDGKTLSFVVEKSKLDSDMISKIWVEMRKAINNNFFGCTMDELVNNYIEREKDNPLAHSRVNLLKKINGSKNVTWKTLMLIVDDVLQANNVMMNVVVKHNNNTKSTHTLEYELR